MGGKKKKVKFSVDMAVERMFDTDLVEQAKIKQAIVKMGSKNYNLNQLTTGYAANAAYPLENYYNFSLWSNEDRKPIHTVSGIKIPIDEIKSYLVTKHNVESTEITILSYDYIIPFLPQWISFYLTEHLGYEGSDNLVFKENKYYNIGISNIDASYNIIANLEVYNEIKTINNDKVVISISPYNDEKDTKLTQNISEQVYYSDTPSRILYVRNTLESSKSEEIDKGTEKDSVEVTELSKDVNTFTNTNATETIPPSPNISGYVVNYSLKGLSKIFIYFPTLGKDTSINQEYIPSIDLPEEGIIELDVMPVTTVRSNYFNINEYDKPTPRYIPAGDGKLIAHRDPNFTKERCEEIKYILKSVNIELKDITDALSKNPDEKYLSDVFLLFGVSPSDNHPMASRVLYDTIDYLAQISGIGEDAWVPPYGKIPLYTNSGTRKIDFVEYPFNTSYQWEGYQKEIKDGIIGAINDCEHEVLSSEGKTQLVYTDNVKGIVEYGTGGVFNLMHFYVYTEYKEVYTYVTVPSNSGNDETFDIIKLVLDKEVYLEKYLGYGAEPYITRQNVSIIDKNNSSTLILKKQLTINKYAEVTLSGFCGITVIGRSYKDNVSNGTTSDKLVIPLLYDVMTEYSPLEKVRVMERCLYMMFYVAQLHIKKLKWYQRGFFKVILQVVALVLAAIYVYFTWDGAGAMTALEVFFTALEVTAVAVGVHLAIKLILKHVDNEFLRAVLITVVVICGAALTGNILDLDLIDMVMLTGIELLNAATLYVDDLTKTGYELLNEKIATFTSAYENTLTQYNETIKSFEEGITVEDLVDINRRIDQNSRVKKEISFVKPSVYYDTVFNTYTDYDLLYTGNFDSKVSQFYDNALTVTI